MTSTNPHSHDHRLTRRGVNDVNHTTPSHKKIQKERN